jgi:hypothetical protein
VSAVAAVLCAAWSHHAWFQHAPLASFRGLVVAFVGATLALGLAPLLVFSDRLEQLRLVALQRYGTVAHGVSTTFERRWVGDADHAPDALLGNGEFSTMADMSTTYQIVEGMRSQIFTRRSVIVLAVAATAPFLPLLAATHSLSDVARHVFASLF